MGVHENYFFTVKVICIILQRYCTDNQEVFYAFRKKYKEDVKKQRKFIMNIQRKTDAEASTLCFAV